MDREELIKEWLSKARHDLGTAEITEEAKEALSIADNIYNTIKELIK